MSTAALGRTLTAAAIMGMMSKMDEERITLQIKGSGEIKLMIAIADTHGHVKAYSSNPLAPTLTRPDGKLAVGEAVGAQGGSVIVIRDYGMGTPFIGQSELVSGEIAEDIAHYFAKSEQQPTAVALGVLVTKEKPVAAAGGFIVQVLPDASDETIDQLEINLNGLKSVTELFSEGLTIHDIGRRVLGDLGMDELEQYPLSYQCDCSQEKMESALISLGKESIREIIDEDGEAEMSCHFCNQTYHFDREALERFYNRAV
jgi:molecular chaperone Hsp33